MCYNVGYIVYQWSKDTYKATISTASVGGRITTTTTSAVFLTETEKQGLLLQVLEIQQLLLQVLEMLEIQ